MCTTREDVLLLRVYQADWFDVTLVSGQYIFLSTPCRIHAIASQIAPDRSSGIHKLETTTFQLRCFRTLTGFTFILSYAATGHLNPSLDAVLSQIYDMFADYVLKNPFYELDMPVRCALFTKRVETLINSYNDGQLGQPGLVPREAS